MVTFSSQSDVLAAVQAHPLCASYLETPTQYVVFYPAAYKIPGGTSVRKSLAGALPDLTLLYTRLENFWTAQTLQISAQSAT